MSLREEIFKIIADGFMEHDGLIIDYSIEKYTDFIISKIKKRIDSLTEKEDIDYCSKCYNIALDHVKEILK